jgi:anti-sigma regulatory factor (Ser/Thr protein kinase)
VLRVPAQNTSLRVIRGEVESALEQHGWAHEPAGRVVLAAGEAVANAIEHGSAPESHVHVEVFVAEGSATVVVRDEGRPGASPPEIIPSAPPPASQQRGRGLVIMTRLAAEIEVGPSDGGTRVRLRFSNPASSSASAA